jgi:Zn-finger protein
MSENFKFVQNRKCEYFPCHKGVDDEKFNCLFCFCPLYALGPECGGNFVYTHGIKDCSHCTLPHDENGYEFIMSKMELVIALGSKK